PVIGACPTVVDDDRRCISADGPGLALVEHRLGEREDHQRGHEEPQKRQPPGALMRGFLLLQYPREKTKRREYFLLWTRRREAQQPPDRRQRQQPEQDCRKTKREREPRHQRTPPEMSALNARCTFASASEASRSV